jgi:tetrahydromethanopterin S-methyltransferase subunit G
MSTITLTRALSRISTLKKTIGKSIADNEFVGVTTGRGEQKVLLNSSQSISSFEGRARAGLQSVIDQIEEKFRLHKAVVKANSIVNVSIEGFPPMTIAEAIEFKRNLQFDKQLLQKLRDDLRHAETNIVDQNRRLEGEINRKVETVYSNDKTRVTAEQYAQVAGPQLEAKEANLLDPLNIRKQIEDLETKIEKFESEVDFALSEINARTSIDV